MTPLQVYIGLSSTVSVWALLRIGPSKLSHVDNLGGSLVAGIAFGWLLWPLFLWALRVRLRKA